MVIELSFPREFVPERLPLRGEITAWVLTFVVLIAATILQVNGARWASAGLTLAGIFVLSAGSISFGNWMDRKTVIRMDRAGISYTNGVRDTTLGWDEIQVVRVLPTRWGARQAQVIGESSGRKSHFEFRTLGVVKYQEQERGRTGFADGDQILETIVQAANLHPVPSDQPSYSYYARK